MWHSPARACLALFRAALLAGTVTAQAPVTFNGVLQSHTFRELNLGGVSHGGQVSATIDCLVSTQSCRKNGFLQYKDSAGQMLLSGPISDCKLRLRHALKPKKRGKRGENAVPRDGVAIPKAAK